MLFILFIIFFFAILLKLYFKLRLNYHNCYACLVDKTAIVTGANAGIGYMTALDFAQRGAKVILACRNPERGEEAVRKIRYETGNNNISYKIFDAASLNSIRKFAEEINASEDKIDILVNNVGGSGFRDRRTEDGHLMIVQVNHLAPFLLTHLLLNKLKAAKSARIVNVASWAAKNANFKIEDLETYRNMGNDAVSDGLMYANSKLWNIMFTLELAKKLEGTNVTVNCLHPGTVNTDFFREFPIYFRIPMQIVGPLYFRDLNEGSRTSIFVSLSKQLEGVNGKFFDNCEEKAIYETAKNDQLSRNLWKKSEELTKLLENEKI